MLFTLKIKVELKYINNMKITLDRTRKKKWENGYLYILPTLRVHWNDPQSEYSFDQRKFIRYILFDVSLIWLTFKLSLFFDIKV